jgi:glycerol-3-phosphate acyltransferase PlsY
VICATKSEQMGESIIANPGVAAVLVRIIHIKNRLGRFNGAFMARLAGVLGHLFPYFVPISWGGVVGLGLPLFSIVRFWG